MPASWKQPPPLPRAPRPAAEAPDKPGVGDRPMVSAGRPGLLKSGQLGQVVNALERGHSPLLVKAGAGPWPGSIRRAESGGAGSGRARDPAPPAHLSTVFAQGWFLGL